jgi:HEAT repeat protein
VEPLVAALADKDEGVQSTAASALGAIGDARAVEPLVKVFEEASWESELREAAAQALEKLGKAELTSSDVRAVKPLVDSIRDATDIKQVQEDVKSLMRLLEKASPQITINDLNSIATLSESRKFTFERIVYEGVNTCGWQDLEEKVYRSVEEVDLSQVRQLARQELIRRGLKA